MIKSMNPVKQMLRNFSQDCSRAFLCSTRQPYLRHAPCRQFYRPFSKAAGSSRKLQRMPVNCLSTLSSGNWPTSAPVVSPGDIRSFTPDLNIPEMTLPELIFRRCDQFREAIAVKDRVSGQQYSFQQLKDCSIRVASALHRQGYRKGDVITTFSTNLPEYPILVLAASCLGVVISPANPAYIATELSHVLSQNESFAIFTIPQLMPVVRDAIADPNVNVKAVYTFGHVEPGAQFFNDLMEDDGKAFPENVDIDPKKDMMVLPYSSGTTGLAKGVMLSHYNLVANILQFRESVRVRPEDNILALLPMFHIYGFLPIMLGSLYDGARLVTVPRFEPELFLQTIQDEKISLLHLVPPMALFLAKQPMVSQYDLSCVQYIICGAAPLGAPLTKECEERIGAALYQGYGMTEGLITNVDTRPGHVGSIGHLLPNTQAKLVNPETGEPVGMGELGEYCIRGPQMMLGYFKNQEATRDMIDGEGWLHTGDLAYLREDGLVVVEDRLKELIKYKGFQVAPAELESLLLSHPAVQDVGVVGVPDEEAGELPRAYVVLKPKVTDVTPQDIADFVEKNVNPLKKLRGGVEFLDEIPKNPSGKILRRVLKQRVVKNNK